MHSPTQPPGPSPRDGGRQRSQRDSRRLHRLLVPIAAAPLALTALSGAAYETLLDDNLDVPWLLRLHTGNFGMLNLQPVYAPLLGLLTLTLIGSGLVMLLTDRRRPRP